MKENLILRLHEIGVIQFGQFKLKSGIDSPFYLDLRRIVSYPDVLRSISEELWELAKDKEFEHICGVPYAALSIASSISVLYSKPMIIKRKEQKDYGLKKMVEGVFNQGDRCLIIEDVISSGISILETVDCLKDHGFEIKDLVTVVDRNQGGRENLESKGYNVTSLFTINDMLDVLRSANRISEDQMKIVLDFLK